MEPDYHDDRRILDEASYAEYLRRSLHQDCSAFASATKRKLALLKQIEVAYKRGAASAECRKEETQANFLIHECSRFEYYAIDTVREMIGWRLLKFDTTTKIAGTFIHISDDGEVTIVVEETEE